MMNDKRQKAERLGMPPDTAEKKLRKAVILELAKQLGKDMCAACGRRIESPESLAVFHIQDWSNNPDQYWDLTNVALGHPDCAAAFGGRGQEGTKMRKIKVTIEDENGNLLPAAVHAGTLYVGGEKNQRYRIRIRNLTTWQVCCVVSVDGRNAISGEPGSLDDEGYVVPAMGETLIDGWRRSDTEVAAFRFSNPDDSYSSQLESPENVGIVGVAVFEEERVEIRPSVVTVREKEYVPVPYPVQPWDPWRPWKPWGLWTHPFWTYQSGITIDIPRYTGTGDTSELLLSCNAAPGTLSVTDSNVTLDSAQVIGTGYGEDLSSPSHRVGFRRRSAPSEIVEIRYDEVDALVVRGILRDKSKRREPRAFPRDVQAGYAAAPPRRVGR
jgi:hypothetical protein